MTNCVCLCLKLFLLQLISKSSGQDIPVVCYGPLEGAVEGEEACSPTQPGTTRSYVSCCVQNETASTRMYLLEQQCTSCGPVLDEAHFFPEVTAVDTTIFINWGLHAKSIPARRFVLSVQSVEGGNVINIPIDVEDLDSPHALYRHHFSPVTAGMAYSISIRAIDVNGISSPAMSIVWKVGEDISPSFTNFTVTSISPSGLVSLSWSLATPGLRPLIHISIQWVAGSDVQPEHDLTDPYSPAYPVVNIDTVHYNQSQLVEPGSVITHTLLVADLQQGETYFVAVTGSTLLGSKTTLFQFTTDPPSSDHENSAEGHTTTHLSILVALVLVAALQTPAHCLP